MIEAAAAKPALDKLNLRRRELFPDDELDRPNGKIELPGDVSQAASLPVHRHDAHRGSVRIAGHFAAALQALSDRRPEPIEAQQIIGTHLERAANGVNNGPGNVIDFFILDAVQCCRADPDFRSGLALGKVMDLAQPHTPEREDMQRRLIRARDQASQIRRNSTILAQTGARLTHLSPVFRRSQVADIQQ